MAGKLKKLAVVALAAVGTAVGTTSGSAYAIDNVTCNNNEFVAVDFHYAISGDQVHACFANAGDFWLWDQYAQGMYVTKIWTGNNRVQWFGDQRWQPSEAIGKNTAMFWPNYPGGVKIEAIRIL
ncbi:hypothetical protein ACH4L5_19485 [Streptomyces sp. NPDC017405]|uniref:hypothetical protein n=1 Tax=unclassified Streptomyces TaxID=2593676 RepID=UPI0037B72904